MSNQQCKNRTIVMLCQGSAQNAIERNRMSKKKGLFLTSWQELGKRKKKCQTEVGRILRLE